MVCASMKRCTPAAMSPASARHSSTTGIVYGERMHAWNLLDGDGRLNLPGERALGRACGHWVVGHRYRPMSRCGCRSSPVPCSTSTTREPTAKNSTPCCPTDYGIEFNPLLRRLTGRITYGWKLIEISLWHFREYGFADAVQTLEHEMLHLYLHVLGKPAGTTRCSRRRRGSSASASFTPTRIRRTARRGIATSTSVRRARAWCSASGRRSATPSPAASAAGGWRAAPGTRASRCGSSRRCASPRRRSHDSSHLAASTARTGRQPHVQGHAAPKAGTCHLRHVRSETASVSLPGWSRPGRPHSHVRDVTNRERRRYFFGRAMPRRSSSRMTSCRSAHTSRLADGVRKRNAGWYVGMSGMPSYSFHGAAQPRDGRVRAQQALRGELAERDDHARADGGELLLEERLALGDLVGLGVAVARRAALQDVADVDVVAAEAHRLDHLGQQLAGGADERLAGAIFVGARRLADEDQRRVGVADAVDDVGALAVRACSACSRRARRGSQPATPPVALGARRCACRRAACAAAPADAGG